MAEIVLERLLTKVYSDGTEAVTGLDLEVGTGGFVVFVGPCGCGRTRPRCAWWRAWRPITSGRLEQRGRS